MSDLTDKMIVTGRRVFFEQKAEGGGFESSVDRAIAAALRVLDDQQLYLCDASHDDVTIVMCDTLADEIEASS